MEKELELKLKFSNEKVSCQGCNFSFESNNRIGTIIKMKNHAKCFGHYSFYIDSSMFMDFVELEG